MCIIRILISFLFRFLIHIRFDFASLHLHKANLIRNTSLRVSLSKVLQNYLYIIKKVPHP